MYLTSAYLANLICICSKISGAVVLNGKPLGTVSSIFASKVSEYFVTSEVSDVSVDLASDSVCAALGYAVQQVLEETPAKASRPWISKCTSHLIELRSDARSKGDNEEERRLHKLIRASAMSDRKQWLVDLAGSGSLECTSATAERSATSAGCAPEALKVKRSPAIYVQILSLSICRISSGQSGQQL